MAELVTVRVTREGGPAHQLTSGACEDSQLVAYTVYRESEAGL